MSRTESYSHLVPQQNWWYMSEEEFLCGVETGLGKSLPSMVLQKRPRQKNYQEASAKWKALFWLRGLGEAAIFSATSSKISLKVAPGKWKMRRGIESSFFANPAAWHRAVMAVGDWPPAAEPALDRFGSCDSEHQYKCTGKPRVLQKSKACKQNLGCPCISSRLVCRYQWVFLGWLPRTVSAKALTLFLD